MSEWKHFIKELEKLDFNLHMKDVLLTWEQPLDNIKAILTTARALKDNYERGYSSKIFQSGLGVSLFRDNSTRTRFSFASACNLLGLTVQDLDEGKSQIAHGETVRETANMISFLSDVIGIRDDKFLGAGNTYMREVASALDDGHREGVLAQRPVIVNLQCDLDHPTQTMADLNYLVEKYGSLENLKGKKIAMTWAYSPSYGKPLSVPQGIIGLMSRLGMDVALAHPEGYNVHPDIVKVAEDNARMSGGKFSVSSSMDEAFKDADIVYPKSWAPFEVMKQRTTLLRNNDHAGLSDLEKSCLAQNAKFQNWECTEEKMKLTKNGKALYMHCLPADISGVSCKQGEVAASVFDRYRIDTYKEAGHKPFIIAALILLGKMSNPTEALEKILKKEKERVKFLND